jgi:hypothetical protein
MVRALTSSVFALLYTTMIHDSHKYMEVLKFLRLKLKDDRHCARIRHTESGIGCRIMLPIVRLVKPPFR